MKIKPFLESDLKCIGEIDSSFDVKEYLGFTKKKSESRYVFEMELTKHPRPFRKVFSHYDEAYMKMLSEFVEEGGSFKISMNGKCVALAITQCHQWNRSLQVWEFLVDKDFRGRKLGRLLMQKVFDYAREKGMRSVFGETQTTNVRAVRFFEHMGFEIAGFDDAFYSNHDVDKQEIALFMRKSI